MASTSPNADIVTNEASFSTALGDVEPREAGPENAGSSEAEPSALRTRRFEAELHCLPAMLPAPGIKTLGESEELMKIASGEPGT